MSKKNQNPFAKPEILENILEIDQNYQKSKIDSLNKFIKNCKTESILKTDLSEKQGLKFANIFSIFKNPVLKFAGMGFVVFCVSFTTIFAGIMVYSQTLPESQNSTQSSIEMEIKKNIEKTDKCKNLKVDYKGDLDIWKREWDQKFQDKPTFYYNSLSITEKKNIPKTETVNFDKNGFLVKQYDFAISCEGKFYQNWNEFYDRSINVKKPEVMEYFKCIAKRIWKWREDRRQVYCQTVDNQVQTTQIHIDELPFLSDKFREKIQKDKIFKIDGGFLGNNYFRNSNSTIYFMDENDILYSMQLYPGNSEYFARNYNLIIGLE